MANRKDNDPVGKARNVLDRIFEAGRDKLKRDFTGAIGRQVGPTARQAIQALEDARHATAHATGNVVRSDPPGEIGTSRTTLDSNQFRSHVVGEGQVTPTTDAMYHSATGRFSRRTIATFQPERGESVVDSFTVGKRILRSKRVQ